MYGMDMMGGMSPGMMGMGYGPTGMEITPEMGRAAVEQAKAYYRSVRIPDNYVPSVTVKNAKIQGGTSLYCNDGYDDSFINPINGGFHELDIAKYVQDGGDIKPEYSDEDILNFKKGNKKQEIDAAKAQALVAGVEYTKNRKKYVFQSDDYTRNMLTSTAAAFKDPSENDPTKQDLPSNFVWISMDNQQVPFTIQDVRALGLVMAQHVQTCTFKARKLKDAISAATSVEQLDAIQWS